MDRSAEGAAYNRGMGVWSFSLGRLFGVEIRLHLLFAFLLSLCVLWASVLERPASRGVVLWMLLLAGVLVRETARGLAAAWYGLEVRSLLLLPTGGLLELRAAARDKTEGRMLALAGPVASIVFGLALAGVALTLAPGTNLFAQRWITPDHLLRSAVWINLLLGAVNLLPAWPLDGAGTAERSGGEATQEGRQGMRARAGLLPGADAGASRQLVGLSAAVALVVLGIVTANWWIVAGGMTVLLFAQAQRQGLLPGKNLQKTTVGEVMLTDFSVLSASATLEDALLHARHTLQDVYPVVRGGSVVGSISRQAAMEALEGGGNSYVQGIMSRMFLTAAQNEPLGMALLRIRAAAGEKISQLVPVLEGERIVGILTPEHLERSVALVNRDRARQDAKRIVEGN